MRIGVVLMEELMNANYRVWMPLQALVARGHQAHAQEANVVEDASGLFQSDVVLFCRAFFRPMERLAQQLREAGIGIVWDNDDDLIALPKGVKGHEQFAGIKGQRVYNAMSAMMRLSDVVTAPSASLARRYEEMGDTPAEVLENYLPPSFLAAAKDARRSGGITIGWHAGIEHLYDVDQLGLRAVFERLLEEHPDLHLTTIGLPLKLDDPRYEFQSWAHYDALAPRVAQFDIGIAALADVQFNRARSNIKVKEYAAAGVPWLASPIGPYVGLGEDQGGRLVPDDHWYEELTRLIADAKARKRLAKKGRRWAKGETIEKNVQRWEQVFELAIERAGAARGARAARVPA
jgi:glycosyltransferase involved in cell wall biosynthesis